MSETTSKIGNFILPFSSLSEKRKKPFTPDMELAAVFSMAELNRKKGGRMILRRAKEKTAFIAKIGYPLWVFPFSKNVLLFDGLNVSNYLMPYAPISDATSFMEHLKNSSKTREAYIAFLTDHANYFGESAREKSLQVKGLLSDTGFLREMNSYCREASKIENQPANTGLLSSHINEPALLAVTYELASLRAQFEKDLKVLHASINLLGNATREFHNQLHDSMKRIREEYALKIDAEEKIVAPRVAALRIEYDERMVELADNFEKQQLPLHTEKMKLEKDKEDIQAKIERYNLEAKTSAENDDAIGKQRWKQKIDDAKDELSVIREKLKEKEKALKALETQRVSEAARLRSELEFGIKEARKSIVEIEASRDAKILVTKQEIEKLEKQTKIVSDQAGKTAKLREANIAQFEKLFVKPALEGLNKAVIFVPFYVACYDSGKEKRYFVLPPSLVGTIDISTRLKGVLGKARIKAFFAPRFKEIASLVDTIQSQCQQNSIFETELRTVGEKYNILVMDLMREEIEKGLLTLKDQGWLSDKDYGSIVASAKTSLSTHT